jgi:hypothetical protein
MKDIDMLIETTYRLSNTLSMMADNEIRFGWDLCHRMELISYEMYKTANELKEISNYIVGGAT